MKVFLSYRFTGEDSAELKQIHEGIEKALLANGHTQWCSFGYEDYFKEQNYTNKQIMEHSLAELDKADTILAYIKSDQKSEGMLLEIGYALAKNKRFILAIKKGIKTTSIAQIAD